MLLLKGCKDAIKISVQEDNLPYSFVSLNEQDKRIKKYREKGGGADIHCPIPPPFFSIECCSFLCCYFST